VVVAVALPGTGPFRDTRKHPNGPSGKRNMIKYAEPWTAVLSDLKNRLERPVEKVFEIYIHTTPERLWESITDGEIMSRARTTNSTVAGQ
jgi:hypothetical protein